MNSLKKYTALIHSAILAATVLACSQARADNMASIAITPATGVVTLAPRWAIGGNLSGFHLMSQDLSLGGGANQFYSIKGTSIPSGGDVSAFTKYIAASGAATPHADIGSKLTPASYSALTSADPDVGYGAVNLYFIHHKTSGDYFTVIVPSSGTASAVTDLKPMSGPGGPATLGASGYFGLTFAAANLGYGLNNFYYLRTDPVTGFTKFGVLIPALLGTSADKFDLGVGGYNALAFTGTDVGFGTDQMYYERLDPITGFTILGTLQPLTGRAADIANLGSVYTTLTFVPGDVGFGSGNFYTTGAVNTTWQSVSFAAIADRAISAGSFTVTPSASSGLPLTLAVVSGSAGSASISGPVAGVYTVTPTAPGLITLQATQAGQLAPVAYEYNMLRQSFTASGTTLLKIDTQPTSQTAATGSSVSLTVVASGNSTVSYQWRKAGANIGGNASATTATLMLANVQAADAASYDVVVSNASGSIPSNAVTLTVTPLTASAPVITNPSLTAGGTSGSAFSFTITGSNSPISFSASPLPAGLSVSTATGVISGTPTSSGTTTVLLGATNATGTGTATLTLTVGAAGIAPAIVSSPLTVGATTGTSFTFTISATGNPTSFSAAGLPAGLTLDTTTGVISGLPTASGTSVVTLSATNSSGTSTVSLTITVGATGVPPVITSPSTASGTAGSPFPTYVIGATGLPTSYTAGGLPAGLTLDPITGAINGTATTAGTYVITITATNSSGVTTTTVTFVVNPAQSSRIVNFSARAISGPGDKTLIVGFVISGDGKQLFIRGVGPTLANYGVVNPLVDPMLTLYGSTGVIASNDDWQTSSGGQAQGTLMAATAVSVGAFALPNGSKDSALLTVANAGVHSTTMLRPNSTTGVALTEIYDMDTLAATRLLNVSARMNVTAGEGTLIAGFVIAGNAPKTVLIRGIGPTLASYGVTNVLADPQIKLFAAGNVVASDDNWETGNSTAADIMAASARVGAFALVAGSKDAALLVTLQPGVYGVQVSSIDTTTGVALVEVYDTQ
jgi:PKD repeat protein